MKDVFVFLKTKCGHKILDEGYFGPFDNSKQVAGFVEQFARMVKHVGHDQKVPNFEVLTTDAVPPGGSRMLPQSLHSFHLA